MNIKTATRFFYLLTLVVSVCLSFSACETEGDLDYQSNTQFVNLYVYMKNIIDNCYYRLEFGDYTLGDSVHCTESTYGNTLKCWIDNTRMSSEFKVYKLDGLNEELQIDSLLILSEEGDEINLLQLASGQPLIMYVPILPVDTTICNLQFFYQNSNQPDSIKVRFMAVDYYSFLWAFEELDDTPDSVKVVFDSITLNRNGLSETVSFNLNFFREYNHGYGADFYYQVTDPLTGKVIRDFDQNDGTIEIAANDIYPVYKTCIMEWPYASADIPFASPEVLVEGDEW